MIVLYFVFRTYKIAIIYQKSNSYSFDFQKNSYFLYTIAKAERTGRLQPLADVSTPGHGQGEGPARYEFRLSGTKEIVGGAGVSEANGVPPGAVAWRLGDLANRHIKRETSSLSTF